MVRSGVKKVLTFLNIVVIGTLVTSLVSVVLLLVAFGRLIDRLIGQIDKK